MSNGRGVMRAALAGWGLLLAAPLLAGGWHTGASLVCSDCHTIHNSSQGQSLRFDGSVTPADLLLRAADPVQLCLACHDGSVPSAPDVVAPVAYLSDPAGGWFPDNPIGQPNPNGHDLVPPSALASPGGVDTLQLTCATCHATHGSPNYRNLVEQPPGDGNADPVSVQVVEQVAPNGSNPSQVYDPANLLYKTGAAEWCNDCHTNFHGLSVTEEGVQEPWLRHPQSQQISSGYGTDFAHWSGVISNRVPVETPTDDLVPSGDDRVFCLSCHKAHGSANPGGLIYADSSTKLSTCQQCHNQ